MTHSPSSIPAAPNHWALAMQPHPSTDPVTDVLAEKYNEAFTASRQARRELWKAAIEYVTRLVRSALPDAAVIVIDTQERELHEVADEQGSPLWYAPASTGHDLPDSLVAAVDVVIADALSFGGLTEAGWSVSAKGRRYLYKTLSKAATAQRRTARSWCPTPEGMAEVTAEFIPGEGSFTLDGANVRYSRETRDRVRAAVLNSGFTWPVGQMALVAHWSVVQGGSGADLTLGCTLLAAVGQLNPGSLEGVALVGELGLNGAVLPVRDLGQRVWHAVEAGVHTVIVAERDAAGLECPDGVTVHGVRDLRHVLAVLTETPEQA